MPRPAKHRDRIVRVATRLFRRNGYAATGLNEILEASGAPRGALYHHFPGGKSELGAAAVRAAGERVAETLDNLVRRSTSAPDFLAAYARLLAEWLERSDYRDGCPIATTLLETSSEHPNIADAGSRAVDSWVAAIAGAFRRDGVPQDAARVRAERVVVLVEGALLLARVRRDARLIIEHLDAFAAEAGAAGV